jgi:hypothetical protein
MSRSLCCCGFVSVALSACAAPSAAPAPVAPAPSASAVADPGARSLVAAALDAIGGEARVRAIRSVHMKTVGSWSSVEASERPEPPWNIAYDRSEQWLDFERGAWREDAEYLDIAGSGGWKPFKLRVSDGASSLDFGGQLKPGGPVFLGDAAEQVLYQPYRLLVAAADARDLRRDGDEVLAGQPSQIVAFHRAGWPVRLWLDARTHRLTAAEVVHTLPDDYFWRVRGDVRDRLVPSRWTLHPSGVWFAHQYDLIRNAIPYHSFVITELEPNAAPADAFDIAADVREAYAAGARGPASVPAGGEQPITELAPGVWLAPARSNALLVAQPGGAVMIDAPISEVYTGRALDEIQHRFGAPAAAVVLTDHIIPTLSGLREAAARGVAIHALDASAGFVADLLAAPHTLAPDALARSGRRTSVVPVTARTAIGEGATRIELIPMRTTLGERALLVWLPAPRLLWVATALTLDGDGHAAPSRLAELTAVIARERLEVDQLVGHSLAPTRWPSLQPAATTPR